MKIERTNYSSSDKFDHKKVKEFICLNADENGNVDFLMNIGDSVYFFEPSIVNRFDQYIGNLLDKESKDKPKEEGVVSEEFALKMVAVALRDKHKDIF